MTDKGGEQTPGLGGVPVEAAEVVEPIVWAAEDARDAVEEPLAGEIPAPELPPLPSGSGQLEGETTPPGLPEVSAIPAPAVPAEAPSENERTVYRPGTGLLPQPPPAQTAPPAFARPTSLSTPTSFTPHTGEPRRIQIGDVLNHIFEVRRFIARGGMGEVFEGINVSSEERVAIKVILPHLATDPAVLGMFRKEARTLTRLGHPALVQYRVLAQEPQLGVFYIVTEYVDGQNLSDVLRELKPSPENLAGLTGRLAAGLASAHALGAIHRDISPDNIMLEGGQLDRAKIIDFGIAKDLDPSSGTIIGDGFAGKLNYVAPEQLGAYGREVGPWTDIYSLGLTILAVARGRDVDMGGTIVDAVDKRRAGPDLSPIPEQLRPLLERMLKPDPAERFRSMDEVVAWVAHPPKPGKQAGAAKSLPAIPGFLKSLNLPPLLQGKRGAMIGGGVVVGVIVAVMLISLAFKAVSNDQPAAGAAIAADGSSAMPADPVTAARTVLDSGLHSVPCSWLDVANIDMTGGKLGLSLRGVSGNTPAAVGQIEQMLRAAGISGVSGNYDEVAPVPASFCGPVQAFAQARASGIGHLSVAQPKFEMNPLGSEYGKDAGTPAANAIFNLDLTGFADDFTIVGVGETDGMQQIDADRKAFLAARHTKPMGGDKFRVELLTTNPGWSGIVLISGKGPFDAKLFNSPASALGADWSQRFLNQVRERGWKAEMVWYRSVDEQHAPQPANGA
ncbi:MAG: serine/threonine-protein kinase [Novosphingobium sp.]